MSIQQQYFFIGLLLIAGAVASATMRKLTIAGAITGTLIGLLVFAGAGYIGLAMLVAFFVLGTAATSWKKEEKRAVKSHQDQSVRRNSGQVLANGGVAAITGLLAIIFPSQAVLFVVMMAASLASATADTLSSELGMVYGRRFYNVITWQKEAKGLDGVISLEGTVIGIIGSALIATIYSLGYGWNINFLFIVIAGTAGNLTDSILGALLERKRYLNNDAVNFLNTMVAAILTWLIRR